MDLNHILLWTVGLSLLALLIRLIQHPSHRNWGWIWLSVAILAVTGILIFLAPSWAGLIASGLWVGLVLTPLLIAANVSKLSNRGHYDQAIGWAKIMRWLHPADGWLEQPMLLQALSLGKQGRMPEAMAILDPYRQQQTPMGRIATILLFRMEADWFALRDWLQDYAPPTTLLKDPELVGYYLRSLAETGDLNGLLSGIAQAQAHLERIGNLPTLNLLRLFAFAFCGLPNQVQILLDTTLSSYSPAIGQFWLATAELANGNQTMARARLITLAETDDLALNKAVNWRLSQPQPDLGQLLDESSRELLARLSRDAFQESRYSGRGFLGQRAYITYGLIILNLLIFALEIDLGGSTKEVVLYRLGAVDPQQVWYGKEWWRLLAANFLHFGSLHLSMNMLGLYFLGRLIEFTLGRWCYLFCYLFTGIGAMFLFTLLNVWNLSGPNIVVGASGAIMGLIGLLGAILLYGWQQEQSRLAARRLRSVLFVVGLQVVFDLTTPQVSFIGHTTGLILGFLMGLLLVYASKGAILQPSSKQTGRR